MIIVFSQKREAFFALRVENFVNILRIDTVCIIFYGDCLRKNIDVCI